MNVLLLHLDGKLPNLALMRLAAHHRALGDTVTLRHAGNFAAVQPRFNEPQWGRVYASLIFERTRRLAECVKTIYPDAIVGGTGWDFTATIEALGVDPDIKPDYSDYPRWKSSMGFTQRGCRLKCSFCVVPKKEGKVRGVSGINEIWRGGDHPRWIHLLDNDFFGGPEWEARIWELRSGKFRVSFTQGINARMLNDETAAAIASVDYRCDQMRERRIYTAWDNRKDEKRLFAGLDALIKHGVKPRHIMVYMLVGYWPGETHADREHRRLRLREYGALPYPMPYERTPELLGFQRWVIGGYDKQIGWKEWAGARMGPRGLGDRRTLPLFRDDDDEDGDS